MADHHKGHWFQQGDVILEQLEVQEVQGEKVDGGVIAEGEATGHAHRAQGEGFKMIKPTDPNLSGEYEYLLQVDQPTEVTHEEHEKIQLPPGTYGTRYVQEYDHLKEEQRNIVD